MSATKAWPATVRLAIIVLLALACIGALLPAASNAQGSVPWRAEYFDNPNLSGQPVRIRAETGNPGFSWEWKLNKPDDGIPDDHFSVRWTAQVLFDAAPYLFKVYTDDGVRLWIDSQLLIDQWRDQTAVLNQATANMTAGYHSLRMEYYDNIGNATAMLWWERQSGPAVPSRWRAEYFNNQGLVGDPALVRDETDINYNWGSGAPAPGLPADSFSVRWTGSISFDGTDNYTFSATVDDGVRVWIDGGLLIDQWRDQSATMYSATRSVTQGQHPVVVEYYDHTGDASVRVSWQKATSGATPGPGTPTATPPAAGTEIVVDDTSAGFQRGGPSEGWFERAVGYGGHTWWTYNSNAQLYNFAKWVPQLPRAGSYQVYAFIPKQRADTKAAKYRIFHGGQDHSFIVNQSVYFDQWVSIGTYDFAANGLEYVYLDDVTGEAYASKNIGFDAVKFVSKDGGIVPTPVPPTPTPTVTGPTSTPMPSPSATATSPGPTLTPLPPTATPPLATPTATLPACPIMPILGFGNLWTKYPDVRSRLGCPVEGEKNTWSGEETFIGGYMFWRSDMLLIYVLYSNGSWQSYADTWESSQAEWDTSIVAPGGYYQPKRGFGKVWREQPGVRDALSWGTTPERGLGASWQAFQGGLMLWSDVQGNFVLYNDHTWVHY